MTKRLRKFIAITAVTVLTISMMTATVSAISSTSDAAPGIPSNWAIIIDSGRPSAFNYVYGLVEGSSTGVTFYCTSYFNAGYSDFYATASIYNRNLCRYPSDHIYSKVKLDYVGDTGTDLFADDWYALSGGTVAYYALPYNYTVGLNQEICGFAY